MRLPKNNDENVRVPLSPEEEEAEEPSSSNSNDNKNEYQSATDRSYIRIPKLNLMGENEDDEEDFDYEVEAEKIPLDDSTTVATHTHRSSTAAPESIHTPKFAWMWKYLSLKGVFHLLGRSIAMCPQAYLVVSALIASLSFGMYFMVLKDQIRDGYTPTNAPSRFETDVMREFWNSSGDPIMSVVILTAKDNGSMLRNDYIKEAVRLHDFLLYNFTLNFDGEKVKYEDLCFPYCNMNYVLNIFYEGLQKQMNLLYDGKALDDETILSFPVSQVGGFKIHLERSFFGLQKKSLPNNSQKYVGKKFGINDMIEGNLTAQQYVSDLEYVKVIMMIFRGDRTSFRKGEMLSKWETSVYDFAMTQYNNPSIEMQVIGTEVLDQEMIRDGQRVTPYFAAGFGFMMLFVVITVIGTSLLYDEFDIGKVFISFGATFCPLIAVSTTYGLVSLLGFRINSFVLVSPFLICGIGVDDAFLMIHAWQRLAPHGYSIRTRMGLVYEEVGPSITITSLTNFISFGIGALTPTPEIRLFCMTTAIAMGIDYIFELILFGPMLVLATKFEKPKDETRREEIFEKGWRKKIMASANWILRQYCKVIGHRIFSMLLLAATATYWYFAIYGTLNIQTRLDSEKILPRDSPIQKPNKILSDVIWSEYHPVTVIVNNPLDITNPTEYQRFWNLVDEFESMEKCKGNISTLLWLRDYETYFKQGDMMEALFGFFGYGNDNNDTAITSSTGIDFSKLETFLQSPFSRHWTAFLKVGHKGLNGSEAYVKSFWFTISYQNTSSWDTRIDLMIKWREIASRYSDMNVTVWEANAMFVDQMLSLKTVALQTGLLTLVCMAVVCAVFIPNPCSLITASIAIASISMGVLGFLSWWHLDLDPVTMAAILMSIGLSVDFTAHVSYHYQLTSKKVIKNGKVIKVPIKGPQEKLVHTLENIAWPMCQAATSTIVCILPLLFLNSYAPIVFVKTIFLVVAWGTLHGLLVLPGLLAALPDFLTNANCYRTFLSTSSHYSCRYVGPSSAHSENNNNNNNTGNQRSCDNHHLHHQHDIISIT